MPTDKKQIIAISAPVEITAAAADGDKKSPPKFTSTFYTGGALEIEGWDEPVVVDLAGLDQGKVLVANLDHDSSKRVGNFAVANDGKTLVASGTASARTPARDEVVGSAEDGYQWQASLEVRPREVESVKKGQSVEVNGQTFSGPLYVTRKGTLKGFAFVSHGADDNTSATIAASAASKKENKEMKAEVKAWVESLGLVADDLTPEQVANLTADFEGRAGNRKDTAKKDLKGTDSISRELLDAKRRDELETITANFLADIPLESKSFEFLDGVGKLKAKAIEDGWSPDKYDTELLRSTIAAKRTVRTPNSSNGKLTNRVLEAAIAQAGRLTDIEKKFSDQELQSAHDQFKSNISLNQLMLVAASANGFSNNYSHEVTKDVLRAAFAKQHAGGMIMGTGFSTIDIDTIIANTANKFLMQGWMSVDQTPLRIAAVKNVRDFKTVTTVSLTGDAQYTKVGATGEIKHATLGELSYTYNADTYAAMLAVTRQDFINDDLGALTSAPQRLGRGGMLKLNDIFWTAWLGAESSGFFAAGNNNLNTAVADVSVGGLDATNTIFANQTDPDGKPLALSAKIMLVPTAQHGAALRLMNSELLLDGTSTGLGGNANVWRNRFRVETSPYMSNSSYTGYSTAAWYLLADPMELPAVVIPALNGRVEPTVETADADFNVLGIQMRGYSDVGVALFEKRAAVKADGGTS